MRWLFSFGRYTGYATKQPAEEIIFEHTTQSDWRPCCIWIVRLSRFKPDFYPRRNDDFCKKSMWISLVFSQHVLGFWVVLQSLFRAQNNRRPLHGCQVAFNTGRRSHDDLSRRLEWQQERRTKRSHYQLETHEPRLSSPRRKIMAVRATTLLDHQDNRAELLFVSSFPLAPSLRLQDSHRRFLHWALGEFIAWMGIHHADAFVIFFKLLFSSMYM